MPKLKVYGESGAFLPAGWVRSAGETWQHHQGDLYVVATTKAEANALLEDRGSRDSGGLRVASVWRDVELLVAAGVLGSEPGVWFSKRAVQGEAIYRVGHPPGNPVTAVARWRLDPETRTLAVDRVPEATS